MAMCTKESGRMIAKMAMEEWSTLHLESMWENFRRGREMERDDTMRLQRTKYMKESGIMTRKTEKVK